MKLSPALAAAALAACASLPGGDEAARTLAAAEAAFAAHSVREDMRAAFIAHFAPDGVFVRGPAWAVARDWLGPRPAPPIVLDWRPQYVEAAASGDLGLSTGPWKLTPRDGKADPAYGQFVSVWTRAPGEPWRVRVDIGISHPQPELWQAPLVARRTPGAPAGGTMAEAEAAFMRTAAGDLARAYGEHGAADLRLYRDGEPPRADLAAALASPWLAATPRATWTIEAQGMAASGELGYARGRFAAAGTSGTWLRVWRREAGKWRVLMDTVTPAPKGAPAA